MSRSAGHRRTCPGWSMGATRMRQYVRAWINEWDLVRLDPDARPETLVVDVRSDYREDTDLDPPD